MIKYLFLYVLDKLDRIWVYFLYTAYPIVYLFFFLTDHIDFKIGSFLL